MKKYFRLITIGWREVSVYRFNVISNAFLSVFRILLIYLMWRVIFSTRTEVSGFTFSMMMTYYIIIMLLTKLDRSEAMANSLAAEIRNGKYSKYIVRPINPMGYYFAKSVSRSLYFLTFNILAAVFWIICFRNYFILPSSLSNLLSASFIFVLGIIFLSTFNYFLTILTFWFLNTSSFFMLKGKILEFLTGALIPLNLLPEGVVALFKYIPFYYVYYFPATVYLGKNSESISFAIITLVIWNVVMFLLNIVLYKKAIKSYSGVGI